MKWLNLEALIVQHVAEIEAWFRGAWLKTPPPLMSSVDIRYAGYKLCEVDTNLFPAGFNNLNPASLPMCVQAMQSAMTYINPTCRRIIMVPEAHTRNQYYQASLNALFSIFQKAGFQVKLAHWAPPEIEIGLPIEKMEREGNRVKVGDFSPCLIVLNNDLSEGVPPILEGIEQTILPALNLGWGTRRKSNHFALYQKVVEEFAQLLDCDPWFFYPEMTQVSEVDFMEKLGMETVAAQVDKVLSKIQVHYKQYEIPNTPFVVIKADNGTYGMGVMSVKSGEALLSLNRKQRTKMSTGKGGTPIHSVLIQEGVYTIEKAKEAAVAEPVIYMIGPHVVGGFYRVHSEKKTDDNLNAPGMHFEPLPFDAPCNIPSDPNGGDLKVNRFYMYGVIARLGALAAAMEGA